MPSVRTLPAPSPALSSDYLATRFEPCGGFVDAGEADPICADCGWLHDEHTARDQRVGPDRSPNGTPR
jgi:hypothetical protein